MIGGGSRKSSKKQQEIKEEDFEEFGETLDDFEEEIRRDDYEKFKELDDDLEEEQEFEDFNNELNNALKTIRPKSKRSRKVSINSETSDEENGESDAEFEEFDFLEFIINI